MAMGNGVRLEVLEGFIVNEIKLKKLSRNTVKIRLEYHD